MSMSQCGGFGTGINGMACAKRGMRAGISSTGKDPNGPALRECIEKG
jgi:hypothetical protein